MLKKLCTIFFIITVSAGVFAQQKFALVIGNANYTGISKLNNPINDANGMADALQKLGFMVDKVTDGSRDQMESAIIRLKNRLSASRNSYGFFYYAGHGVQNNGENYLIPIGASIPDENFLRDRAVSVQAMLGVLNDAGNELNIVILDACRDNPFGWARSGSRGLALVSAPVGSIVMFATSAGSTAADGTGKNGLFTGQLLKNLAIPANIRDMLDKTGQDVLQASGGKQHPEISSRYFGVASIFPGYSPSQTDIQPPPPQNLYEQLVNATGTTTITVTQDTVFKGSVIAKAASVTLRGDVPERTLYNSDEQGYSIHVEKGVTLILESITLKNIQIWVKEGGTLVMNSSATITGCNYTGVSNYGTFTMNGGTITNNSGNGVHTTGTFTMNEGIIYNNKESGVYVYTGGSFFMNGGSISNNNNHGVFVAGNFTMKNGRIENNTNSSYGGGGVRMCGNFSMSGGTISGNHTSGEGGGVYMADTIVFQAGSFNMFGGSIANNRSSGNGGGVYVESGKFIKSGGTIYGSNGGSNANMAGKKGDAVFDATYSFFGRSINRNY